MRRARRVRHRPPRSLSEQPSLRLWANDSVGRQALRLLEALNCPLGQRAVQAIDWTGAFAETPQAALKLSNGLGTGVGRVSGPARECFGAGQPVACWICGHARRGHREQHGRGQQAGQPSQSATSTFT